MFQDKIGMDRFMNDIWKLFSKQCLRDWGKFSEKNEMTQKKKKKKGRNILWGKKAINFFWKSIFFFPPPPPPQIHNEEKEKWSMQVWFAGILYSILASLLSCYIKSSPLLLRFVPFIRLFSYSTRYTLCLLVDSQRIRISSSQFNPLS